MPALIAQLLATIATAVVRENIADEAVGEILGIASVLVSRGVAAQSEIVALNDQIQTFVNENREPTAEEWEALRARSDAAHDTIQSADVGD